MDEGGSGRDFFIARKECYVMSNNTQVQHVECTKSASEGGDGKRFRFS